MIQNPSVPQAEIFRTWEETEHNILIQAVAGSGKTTTLMHIMKVLCEKRTLFLAFNKTIQEEIQSRIIRDDLSDTGLALTLHSLGFKSLRNHYSKVTLWKGKRKNFTILKDVQSRYKSFFRGMEWKEKAKIGYTLMTMNNISRLHLTNDRNTIEDIMYSMGNMPSDNPGIDDLWEAFIQIRGEYDSKRNVVIDFTDMIYLPVVKRMFIDIRPSYLMIDECQDLNLAQHAFVDLLLAQGDVEKWIAVGDRNQAIYGFSGASARSFDLFRDKDTNTIELPLNICYRCDELVIGEANKVYNVMEGFSTLPGIVQKETITKDIEDNSMVICRNTAPLINLYFELLSQKRDCYIKGEDILNQLLSFIKPYAYKTNADAYYDMLSNLERLRSQTGKELEIFILKQNMDNFIKIVQNLSRRSAKVSELEEVIKSLFVEEENAIMLATIHKSKGMEADTVYILNENLIPSKFANTPEQITQEINLKYVARTRAKHKLVYLNLD